MIKIYDTKAREKRPFVPVADGKVNMYVCGPTVYNYIHIGNARTFISFDTIRRYLIWRGYEVKFVQNITDVDDKIIKKANEEGRSASDVAAEYAQAFIDDMRAAGVMDPDVRPRATEEINEMIALVEKLIEGGHAYEVEGDVYFAVRSYEGYGQLSGRVDAPDQLPHIEQGARQQKNGAAGRGQRSSQGFVRFHSGDHRFVQQGFSKRMHWVRLLSSQIYRDREQSEDTALSENSKRAAPCANQVYKKLRGL